ncbi:hypothetical protein RB598_005301 [Gaeumannomyces tritici]
MSRGGTTLYVTGFSHGTRARDLAYEFERYGRLVRCDIPAPRSASSRLSFAFVEYEDRRDADEAYHDMHNKRLGRDDVLKIEWARTPPSASWRFESGRDRDRAGDRAGDRGSDRAGDRGSDRGGDRSRRSPRRNRSPSPTRRRDYSPRKDSDRRDRDRDRDYDRDSRRDRDRSRSPDNRDRDREMKDVDREDRRENGTNGDERKAPIESPPPAHDDLDVAE